MVELRGSFSWLIFLAGGILAVICRNAGRRKKVRCSNCEALFDIRTPLSIVARVFFWLFLAPAIITLVVLLAAFLHTLFSHQV